MDGGIDVEVRSRIIYVGKLWGGMRRMLRCKSPGINANYRLNEGVVVLITFYGAKTWGNGVAERKRLNVMEMRCLRSMCEAIRIDQAEQGVL